MSKKIELLSAAYIGNYNDTTIYKAKLNYDNSEIEIEIEEHSHDMKIPDKTWEIISSLSISDEEKEKIIKIIDSNRPIHFSDAEPTIYNKDINKKYIYYTEVNERIPEENRDNGLYYYECRTCEEETTIERKVTLDFSGMLITSEDILGDKEYIEKEDLFNDPQYEFFDDSDIYDKVYESLNNDLEEDNEM